MQQQQQSLCVASSVSARKKWESVKDVAFCSFPNAESSFIVQR
jgi:hypothetical protein